MFFAPCKVCQLLDNDNTEKPVSWCDVCKAYICKSDTANWVRRAEAATLNWGQRIISLIHKSDN